MSKCKAVLDSNKVTSISVKTKKETKNTTKKQTKKSA